MIDLYPTVCNLCGGQVVFISNAEIYGREYGSGRCYRCTNCGAYVGTHEPRSNEAMGLLSDAKMREAKKRLHDVFDKHWVNSNRRKFARSLLYRWLAVQMSLPIEECHIGYFDINQLEKAYRIMLTVSDKTMKISRKGNIHFE